MTLPTRIPAGNTFSPAPNISNTNSSSSSMSWSRLKSTPSPCPLAAVVATRQTGPRRLQTTTTDKTATACTHLSNSSSNNSSNSNNSNSKDTDRIQCPSAERARPTMPGVTEGAVGTARPLATTAPAALPRAGRLPDPECTSTPRPWPRSYIRIYIQLPLP